MNAKPFLQLRGEDICALARNGFTLHNTEPYCAETTVPDVSPSGLTTPHTHTYLLHFISDTGDTETFTVTTDQQSLMNCLSGLDSVQVFVKLWNYRER